MKFRMVHNNLNVFDLEKIMPVRAHAAAKSLARGADHVVGDLLLLS